MRIHLEYSPHTGCLNYRNVNLLPDIEDRYEIVCSHVPIYRANQFTEWLIERYPSVNSREKVPYPDIVSIRKEFFEFLRLDQELVEKDMNRLQRQRMEVLNHRQP